MPITLTALPIHHMVNMVWSLHRSKTGRQFITALVMSGRTLSTQVPSIRCSDCGRAIVDESHATAHATKTGHVNFEEYVPQPGEVLEQAEIGEQKATLSEEEKQRQLEIVQQKIKERKVVKEVEKEQEELEQELLRRKNQKEMQIAKEKFKEDQEKRAIEKEKKEKLEAQKYHEELKRQVAEDKKRREMELASKANPQAAVTPQPSVPKPTEQPRAQTTTAPKVYEECTIQVRLTNGGRIEAKFKPTDTLKQLFDWVTKNRTDGSGPYSLVMSSPRKTFTPDMSDTLLASDLVPRALLILTKR